MVRFIRRQLDATVAGLRRLTGNARAVLLTEPWFGVPYNLISTYASVYMLALGCSAERIGLISSIGLALSMVLSLAGGPITDRLGRRRTTFLFDMLSWSGATILWAFAGGFAWFLAAAIVNSAVRIVQTSWNCLMIEDTPQEQRVHLYTWVYIVGVMAGLIAPVAGLFVRRWGLVPAMRGLYLFSFVVMTAMFLVRNTMLRETTVGLAKLRESRHASLRDSARDFAAVSVRLLHSPATLCAFAISILVSIQAVLKNTFQAILLTKSLGFSDASIALFPAVGAVTTLFVYFLLMPTLSRRRPAAALALGLAVSAAGAALLALCPPRRFLPVIASTILSSIGSSVIIPISDTLVANTVEEGDRSKALSLFYVLLYAASAPFGYIGGWLFDVSPRLPFLAAASILLLCLLPCLIVARLGKGSRRQENPPRCR